MSDTPETCPDVFTGGRRKPRPAVPPRTVYVVVGRSFGEGSGIIGVFSDRPRAEDEAGKRERENWGGGYVVEEWALDVPPCDGGPVREVK